MKHSYHTDIALQYKLGVLNPSFTKRIPSSTLHRWKCKDFSTLVGAEYVNEFEQNLEMIKDLLSRKYLLNAAKSIYYIYSAYAKIFRGIKNRGKLFRQSKGTIVSTIDRVKGGIGLGRALRAFGISYQQYYKWKRGVECKEYPFSLCRKLNQHQLTVQEVNTIRSYLTEPQYSPWSLSSVYYQMLRDKAAFMSITSFYKYANLLMLTRPTPPKRRHGKGIRAAAPLRILHMDVTIYRPLDRSRVYIYILMDNYSRCILSWRASLEYSSRVALENLREAYEKYNLGGISPFVDLVTDDGSENKGAVRTFLDTPGVNIKRLIAQKDIIPSNSMVEAVNKRLKYDFLFRVQLQDFKHTLQYLPGAIEEYVAKPHSALYGLTPAEVLNGSLPDKGMFKPAIRQAGAKRRGLNQNQECLDCLDTAKS